MGFTEWITRLSMPKRGIRFVCDVANRLQDKNPPNTDVIIQSIYESANKTGKPYFRNYTLDEIKKVCKGNIEILAFTAMHQRLNTKFFSYANDKNLLMIELQLIYDIIMQLNPKFLSPTFKEFADKAEVSLYEHPEYVERRLKQHNIKM